MAPGPRACASAPRAAGGAMNSSGPRNVADRCGGCSRRIVDRSRGVLDRGEAQRRGRPPPTPQPTSRARASAPRTPPGSLRPQLHARRRIQPGCFPRRIARVARRLPGWPRPLKARRHLGLLVGRRARPCPTRRFRSSSTSPARELSISSSASGSATAVATATAVPAASGESSSRSPGASSKAS